MVSTVDNAPWLVLVETFNIDGKPAGIAPVYPWIYTGGVDPFLWEPIPGVQTLSLRQPLA